MHDYDNFSIFGNFYPHYQRGGNTTNALVFLIQNLNKTGRITLFGNADSKLPHGLSNRVKLVPCWTNDDPISLIKSLILMIHNGSGIYLFNIYPTAFGRKPFTNLVGMMVPVLLSIFRKREVVVYMHNFVESQEIELLGYQIGAIKRFLIRFLETLVAKRTTMFTTLPSVSQKMSKILKSDIREYHFPYLEASFIHALSGHSVMTVQKHRDIPRILLFGTWGPQKDMLYLISRLAYYAKVSNIKLEYLIAGGVNKNFPEYSESITRSFYERYPPEFKFKLDPSEEEVAEIFINSDAIILPYNATGGQSGVMQLAAFYDLSILAYDTPQLREQAKLLGIQVSFFKKGDNDALSKWLRLIKVRKFKSDGDLEKKINTLNSRISDFLYALLNSSSN